MAGTVSAMADTYGVLNYPGELIMTGPTDHPFLGMMGGLVGGPGAMETDDWEFGWQTTELRDSTANNVAKEGQDAPDATSQTRAQIYNVTEIHQATVAVTYEKLAATQRKAGVVNNGQPNPVGNELDQQLSLELMARARDINASFISGSRNVPTDNTDYRKTAGIVSVLSTNTTTLSGSNLPSITTATDGTFTSTANGLANDDTVIFSAASNTELTVDTPYFVVSAATNSFKVSKTKGGTAITFAATGTATGVKGVDLTEDAILDTAQSVFENGGLSVPETFTLVCGAWNKRQLSTIFIKNYNYRETSRTVGGINVLTIETDFGTLNILVDRQWPRHKVGLIQMGELAPVFMRYPQGHFFAEPLGKKGAYEQVQLYGSVGLKYGTESHHGLVLNTSIG